MKLALAGILAIASAARIALAANDDRSAFVRVSPRDSHYFELSNSQPYIPIGLNLIAPSGPEAQGLEKMEEWMRTLAGQGGNYIRVWISSPFWDIEHERSGVYDEAKARRIDQLLALAQKYGIRVKLTLEHFREMTDGEPRQKWANKPLHLATHGGTATNMADFFTGEASRARFKQKLAWLAARYGDNPAVFGWELWNEVDAVRAKPEEFMPWTATMLGELHRLFPRNLALQSLGSYDVANKRVRYREHSLLPDNDVAQVHRYLDLGAPLELCHGPMDVLTADAVRDLRSYDAGKPVILAETGAVEPKHTGPFKLYAADTQGMLLHDALFAPFFAGAAGPGQIWHWDVYVDRNKLWYQFGRFAEAVRGIDPAAEHFVPRQLEHSRLRLYALVGRTQTLVWCRDAQNTWETELAHGVAPELLRDLTIDFSPLLPDAPTRAEIYDPWKNERRPLASAGKTVRLPAFSRSIVVRMQYPAGATAR